MHLGRTDTLDTDTLLYLTLVTASATISSSVHVHEMLTFVRCFTFIFKLRFNRCDSIEISVRLRNFVDYRFIRNV